MTAKRETREALNLTLFMHTHARHGGMLLHEWLLKQAHRNGISGGSVFRAIAGIGRHGVLHDESFFELANDLPLRAEFVLTEEEAERMLDVIGEAGVGLVYTLTPVRYGVFTKREAD